MSSRSVTDPTDAPITPAGNPTGPVTPGVRSDARTRWTHVALVANLVGQIGIIVTGGAVRLTGSGLGCSTWPQCEPGEFTPQFHDATSIHPFIEFGNRTLSGVLVAIGLAVALLVWTDRGRPRSYRWLGLAPLGGVVVQAVVGGITVLLDLNPAVVASHLLISMALVAASTLLLHRSREGDGPGRSVIAPDRRRLASGLRAGLVVATVLALVLGVVVTGSGPHSGDEEVGYRFALDPYVMARAHAGAVWLFLVVLVAQLWLLRRATTAGSAPVARRSALVLLVVTLAQGAIGYVQLFTGLPAALVNLHMLGAALLTAAVTWHLLTLRVRD
ncbi:COX15/CtaA family protein [Cellulomonas hominis]